MIKVKKSLYKVFTALGTIPHNETAFKKKYIQNIYPTWGQQFFPTGKRDRIDEIIA